MTNNKTYVHAVILAAGNSTRMGENKMFMSVAGKPVVLRSITEFVNHPLVDKITVVTRREDVFTLEKLIAEISTDKKIKIVFGGSRRIDSVAEGIKTVKEKDAIVCIHDGARPLVTEKIITDAILGAETHGGAIPAVKVKDTVKIVSHDGFVAKTPDRSTLYSAQTPQCFRFSEFKSAMEKAIDSGEAFTDDASVFAYNGGKVFITEGSYENLKITTYDDVLTAQVLLINRRKDGLTL